MDPATQTHLKHRHPRGGTRNATQGGRAGRTVLNRKDLVFSDKLPDTRQPVRLITQYSKQHTQIKHILNQFWPLLTADPIISKYVKTYPDITYRRSPSLRDRLIKSHHSIDTSHAPTATGTYQCGKCDVCAFVTNSRTVTLPNGDIHTIRHRVTCTTVGVVYPAQCQCGSYYVGKTKRPFQIRIRDHIKPLYKNTTTTAINRHIAAQHNSDPHVILFSALEHVPSHARGGSIDNRLLQLETKWIHILHATSFPGLNKHISFKPFL